MIDKVYRGTRAPLLPAALIAAVLTAGCSFDVASIKYGSSENLASPIECVKNSSSAPKKVAILHFGLKSPEQTQFFPQIQKLFTDELLRQVEIDNNQLLRDATHITIEPQHISLLGRVSADVSAQVREISRQFDSQLVVFGHFFEIKRTQRLDFVDELTEKSKFTLSLGLQIFDGPSGQLVHASRSSHTITEESDLVSHQSKGLNDKGYINEIREDALDTIITKQLETINQVASCMPLKGRVTSTYNSSATIDLGSLSKVKVGDQFDLIHPQLVHTNSMGEELSVDNKVGTLLITDVSSNSAVGRIENLSRTSEIQPGDRIVSQ